MIDFHYNPYVSRIKQQQAPVWQGGYIVPKIEVIRIANKPRRNISIHSHTGRKARK